MTRFGLVWVVACALVAPSPAVAETTSGKSAAASTSTKTSTKKSTQKKKKKRTKKKRTRTSKKQRPTSSKSTAVAVRNESKLTPVPDLAATPAVRYNAMASDACLAELAARKIAYQREPATPGVVTPVRLTAPIRGVEYRTNQAAAQRATTKWEIADCRLVLALDDMAAILARHDVVEVRHYSLYRSPPDDFAGGEATRHPGGMAIDAARFHLRDGTYLDVEEHYHGRIGERSCGEGATPPHPATPEATKLRAILCELAEARLFNVVLTPNHDRPHHNHFHLEITAGKSWFLVK